MKRTPEPRGPSRATLRDVPEVDFERYGRAHANPFAARMRAEGWDVVHEGPSAASLAEIPEIELSRGGAAANPYAARIRAAGGYELQVGRRRPSPGKEVGPTVVKSVRLPPRIWAELEAQARARGVSLHAFVRAALVASLRGRRPRRRMA
jgi:hypothetical protein